MFSVKVATRRKAWCPESVKIGSERAANAAATAFDDGFPLALSPLLSRISEREKTTLREIK